MNDIEYPFELVPGPYGTKLDFFCAEEGEWAVEVDACLPGEQSARRVRLSFSGVVQARINDDADREAFGEYMLMKRKNSPWTEKFLESYILEFGTSLLPVVKNVGHFIIRGHDIVTGVLARGVTCDVKESIAGFNAEEM